MTKSVNMLALIVSVSLLGSGCGKKSEPVSKVGGMPSASQATPVVFYDESYNSQKPSQIRSEVQSLIITQQLSYEQWCDYGSSWFLDKQWDKAEAAYESAVNSTRDTGKQSAALLLAAQSANMSANFIDAGAQANLAHKLTPSGRVIGGYRFAFWGSAGDELEQTIADDYLKQVNLSMEGAAVCDPLTICAIVAVASLASGTAITIHAINEDMLTREDVVNILVPTFGVAKTLSNVMSALTPAGVK